jgi:hypothetical protein
MTTTVTDTIRRVSIPNGLALYEHQERPIDARLRGYRWRVVNGHRQSGKDITGVVDIASAAFTAPGVYAYVLPTFAMARQIIWDGVRASDGVSYLDLIPPELILEKNEAELSITLATRAPGKVSRLLFRSGDKPDRLRGLPLKGAVLSEYAQFESSAAFDVIKPALVASGGGALVLSTPMGIGNHFHQLWAMAQGSPDWWSETWTIADTHHRDGRPLITDADLEREELNGQRLDWLNQEYRCQFVAGLISSIFGDVLTQAERAGRITEVPHRSGLPVFTAWDLGVDDSTVIIYLQPVGEMLHVIDVDEFQGLTLAGLIARARAHAEYNITKWYGPHDIVQRDLSAEGHVDGTAVTRQHVAGRLGVKFKAAPKLSLAEGLDATRRLFPRLKVDQRKGGRLLEAVSEYRRTWDPERKLYADKPLHNWCSHFVDALRTFAVAYRDRDNEDRPLPRPYQARTSVSHAHQGWPPRMTRGL